MADATCKCEQVLQTAINAKFTFNATKAKMFLFVTSQFGVYKITNSIVCSIRDMQHCNSVRQNKCQCQCQS